MSFLFNSLFFLDRKENPRVRFNKEGTLLAVSANDNKIKILAKDSGLHSLHTSQNCSDDASRDLCHNFKKVDILNTVVSCVRR